MGVVAKKWMKHDMEIANNKIVDLLGSKAVAGDKTVTGRVLEFIGWVIDLDKRTVAVAPKNLYKSLHGFFTTDISKETISVKELEQLASWATRYSLICRPLKPFVYSFYRNRSYHQLQSLQLEMSEEVRLDILLWRVFLCASHLRPQSFARSIESFRENKNTISLESDACLTGFGVVIGGLDLGYEVDTVWCGCGKTYDFQTEYDSSFQNTMEFIGIVIGISMIAREGIRQVNVKIVGDSMSALCWAGDEKYRSPHIRRAASVLVAISIHFGIEINESEHIAGIDNEVCDSLSRGDSPRDLGWEGRVSGSEGEIWIEELLDLVDPTILLEKEEDFISFWGSLSCWINRL
jgi:hypothetical protein